MRSDIAISAAIALAGVMAIGQAVNEGLAGTPHAVVVQSRPTCPALLQPLQHERKISFAAVGDTVTDWGSHADTDPASWVTYVRGGGVRFAGGYAHAATNVQGLAAHAPRLHVDVLVIMAGTTDLRYSNPRDQVELGLQRIVDGVGADHVLLSSIPPVRGQVDSTLSFNDFLSRVAYRHGWSFVDAGNAARGKNCEYRRGLSTDGVRPTAEGARLIGDAIRSALTGRAEFASPTG